MLSNTAPYLENADYGILLAPLYDGDPDQVGVPFVTTLARLGETFYYEQTMSVQSGYALSPRIYAIAVYVMRRNHVTGSWTDYARIKTVSINDFPAPGTPYTITFNENDISIVPESSWYTDSGNRAITLDGLTNYDTYAVSNATWHDTEEAALTVKPGGFVVRKEYVFAWQTDGDPGLTKMRISTLDDDRGQYDVFLVTDIAWKGGSTQPINYALEWDGRIIMVTDTNLYQVEPADPLRSRDSYMNGVDSIGVGCTAGFLRTIALGKDGMFFCTLNGGPHVYRSGRAQPIAVDVWLQTVWLGYTENERLSAIGGYNNKRGEYWLAVGSMIYVFHDRDVTRKYWRTRQYIGFTPAGFVNDTHDEFIMYGDYAGSPVILTTDSTKNAADFGDAINGTIYCGIESKSLGPRTNDILTQTAELTIQSDDTQAFTLKMYGDKDDSAWETFPLYGSEKQRITLPELRAKEFAFGLYWQYNQGTRPTIYSMIINTVEDNRRAQ